MRREAVNMPRHQEPQSTVPGQDDRRATSRPRKRRPPETAAAIATSSFDTLKRDIEGLSRLQVLQARLLSEIREQIERISQ